MDEDNVAALGVPHMEVSKTIGSKVYEAGLYLEPQIGNPKNIVGIL